MDFPKRSARELRDLAASGEVSPTELVEAALARIEAVDGKVGAFLSVEADSALARARELEAARARGEPCGPLYGVPIGLKDNLNHTGWPLTCASRVLEGYRASYDATAVRRLLDAGAVPVGRCNMDEFAFGSSTEHSAFQATRNPWKLDRIPGGSSGGSAAAVAAGMVPLAFGSDTGGSIRQPAALCGVAGLKPTYGRVSRFGLVAFGSSLDQIGPFSRDLRDSAVALGVISGRDPRDATSLDAPAFDPATIGEGVRGLRIGVPAEYFDERMDASILATVRAALARLEAEGATLVPLSLPTTPYAIPTYYLVATSEASSNLARFDGVRYGNRAAAKSLLEH
ncbi:MAG: amidase family protein, partial [Planctomycetota bacterium]